MRLLYFKAIMIFCLAGQVIFAQAQAVNKQIDSLNQLGAALKFTKPDSTFYLAQLALGISNINNYQEGKAKAYNTMGLIKTSLSEYDSASYFLELALALSRKANNLPEEAESLNNLGIVKDELGDHRGAIEKYLAALKIYERLKDLDGQARMNNNLGIVYKDMKQFDKVVVYYQSALHLYDSLSNEFGVAALSNNLSTLYNQMGDYELAAEFGEKGKVEFGMTNATQYIPYSQINLGDAYRELKQYDLAASNLDEAIATLVRLGNVKEQSDALRSLSHLYQARGQNRKAIETGNESLRLARQVDAKVYIKNALMRIAEAYEADGDLKSSIRYLKQYEVAKDSLFNEERSLQISRLQTLFESEKKENVIASQQLAIVQGARELSSRRNQVIVLLCVASMLLLGGVLFYQMRQAKNKRQMHDALIAEKQKGIEAIIHAQDEERKRIAKDLHDGIGQQLGGLKIKLQNFEESIADHLIKDKIHLLKHIVDDTANDLRTISHEMMPRALTEVGLAPAIRDVLENSLGASSIAYHFENSIEGERYPEQVEISIYRILQEMISNILKHTQATNVSVQLLRFAKKLVLIVEDNGKGINVESESGHGILNIKHRAEMLGGSVVIETRKDNGIVGTISIPIA